MKNLRELTKAEEELMQVLWQLEKGFIKDLIPHLPEVKPGKKPSYTTVATVLKVLETKGFVAHNAYGNVYEFYPLVSKTDYQQFVTTKVVNNYFGGSLKSLVSFFVSQENVDLKELDEIKALIEKNRKITNK